jgi:hypothetical protein
MTLKNTGVMCLITVPDANRKDGFKHIDVGNYYENNGTRCVVTTKEIAIQYAHKIDVPVYVRSKHD